VSPSGRQLLFGALGAALLLGIVLVLGLGGGARSDWSPRHEAFYRLLSDLGYKLESSIVEPSEKSLLVLLPLETGSSEKDEEEVADLGYTEAEAVLAAGGRVIAAGREWDEFELEAPASAEANGGQTLAKELVEAAGEVTLSIGSVFPREGLPDRARPLIWNSKGVYAFSAEEGGGRLILFADDELFSEDECLDPGRAALINALASPSWEGKVAIEGRIGGDSRSIIARALSMPRVFPVAVQALLLALLAVAASSLRREGRRAPAPPELPTSLRTVEAVGDFYRKADAAEAADEILAGRFASALRGLFSLPRGGSSGEEEAKLASLVSASLGIEEKEILSLSRSSSSSRRRSIAEREARRQDILERLGADVAKGKDASHGA